MKRLVLTCSLVAVTLLVGLSKAHAQPVDAYTFTDVPNDAIVMSGAGQELGWEFTVNEPILVESLGNYDHLNNQWDGVPVVVTLWDDDFETILASQAIVDPDSMTFLAIGNGVFHFKDLPSSVTLLPGNSYAISTSYFNVQPVTFATGTPPSVINNFNTEGAINFVQGRSGDVGLPGFFPNTTATGTGYFGPNFKFSPQLVIPVDNTWIDALGGNFDDGANWDNSLPPVQTQNVIFNLSNTYTVDFTRNELSKTLTMNSGDVTFNLSGNNYEVVETIIVGDLGTDNAILRVQNSGTLSALGSPTGLGVGIDAGSQGTVKITGPSTELDISENSLLGLNGTAVVSIENGGVLDTGPTFIGTNLGSNGSVTVNGDQSTWNIGGALTIGSVGSGSLTIENKGKVINASDNNKVVLGALKDSSLGNVGTGTVVVDGDESTWIVNKQLSIGELGIGTVTISNGATMTTTDLDTDVVLGVDDNSTTARGSGTVTVTDGDSSWNNASGLVVGRKGTGLLIINGGGSVTVGKNTLVGEETGGIGTVAINTGTVSIDESLAIGGSLTTDGGTGSVTVNAGGVLRVDKSIMLWPNGSLELNAGGTLSMVGQALTPTGGTFTFNAGTIEIREVANLSSFTLPFSSLSPGQNLNVEHTFTIDGGELFTVEDTILTAGLIRIKDNAVLKIETSFTNSSPMRLEGFSARITGDRVFNESSIRGTGIVTSTLENTPTGEVRISSADELSFTQTGNFNLGGIKNFGGIVEFGGLTNFASGFISGRGTFYFNSGLANSGVLAFSGGFADVNGDITNNTGGSVSIAGGSTTTFYDDVTEAGGTIYVDAGSTAVFLGSYNGGTNGGGTVFASGDLRPGHSPASVSFGGDLLLSSTASISIEIGGPPNSTLFDQVHINGEVTLSGTLDVSLINDFEPGPGDEYVIITYDSRQGEFDTVQFPSSDLVWQIAYGETEVSVTFYGLKGDINLDGTVDRSDLAELLKHYGTASGADWEQGDFNNDGLVGLEDLLLLKLHFGQSYPSSSAPPVAVPEPSGMLISLLGLLGGLVLHWRRKSQFGRCLV